MSLFCHISHKLKRTLIAIANLPRGVYTESMTDTELATLSKADLIQLIHQHEATLARLQGRITELETQLEEARRTAKRQAAPFSKGPPPAATAWAQSRACARASSPAGTCGSH